ncbi:MAG: hypothetical protein ABIJ21_03225 [Nanoarchaeota archaeon]
MIVIVIIAIVFLGVAILLIRKWGILIGEEVPKIFPPENALWQPTAENPILFNPANIEVKRGENKIVTLQVYNYATADVTCTIGFTSSGGDPLEFKYSAANREIPVGMVGEWKINIKAPKTISPEVYIYTSDINCVDFTKQSDVVVTVG